MITRRREEVKQPARRESGGGLCAVPPPSPSAISHVERGKELAKETAARLLKFARQDSSKKDTRESSKDPGNYEMSDSPSKHVSKQPSSASSSPEQDKKERRGERRDGRLGAHAHALEPLEIRGGNARRATAGEKDISVEESVYTQQYDSVRHMDSLSLGGLRSVITKETPNYAEVVSHSRLASPKTPGRNSTKPNLSMGSGQPALENLLPQESRGNQEERETGSERDDTTQSEDWGIPDQPTLKDLLIAITKNGLAVTELKSSMDGVKQEVLIIRDDANKMRHRISELESRVSELEDQMAPALKIIKILEKKVQVLEEKDEAAENRDRRCNVRVVGLPEKAEGRDPTAFAESWLCDVFGKESFSAQFAVERAHRVNIRQYQPGGFPRPFLIKILNYRDKEYILRKAREQKGVKFNGAQVSFYSDYATNTQGGSYFNL